MESTHRGEPGRLLASGRDSDIFEYGRALVVRRSRHDRSMEREARTMRYVRDAGYPVPRVDDVRADGREIVMERLDGPTMLDAMGRDPRSLRRNVDALADLHDALHTITAPDWFRVFDDDGTNVLHLDLHPGNVVLTRGGPVVIDWANAARGTGTTDVALTYALLIGPQFPGSPLVGALVEPARRYVARAFLRRYRVPGLATHIAYMAALKQFDNNMRAAEVRRLDRVARRWQRRADREQRGVRRPPG